MTLRTPVEKAIWFIESHFNEEITLDDLAVVCELSRFQTSRLFSSTPAQTMGAYLRGRRLTEAARALADGAPNILTVAIEAGYGSHEAFSRAFLKQFGTPPSSVRTREDLQTLTLVEPMRQDPAATRRLRPPTVVRHERMVIAGIGRRFPVEDFAGIPSLWQEFRAFDNTIPEQQGHRAFGVVSDMSTNGSDYRYVAGVQVTAGANTHEPLQRITLPAQRWAMFTHTGHITTIISTIHAIFAEALPTARLSPGENPDLLEVYPETFDPSTGRGGVELWVPLLEQ